MELSQRRTPRYPFSGPAEVVYANGVVVTEITELSLYGCYLKVISSLPRGTIVTVKIRSGGRCFEARASVLYSQPMLGTGFGFRTIEPQFYAILQEWLQQSLDKQNTKPSISDFENEI